MLAGAGRAPLGLALAAVAVLCSPVHAQAPGRPAGDLPAGSVRSLLREGRYAEAVPAAREMLAAAEREHGEASLEAANALDILVEALWRDGKGSAGETRRLAERAVEIKERALGPDHAGLVVSLSNLGRVHLDSADHPAARAAYERALRVAGRQAPRHRLETARALNGLGWLLYAEADYEEAKRTFQRTLEIREAELGPEDPAVAEPLTGLGTVLKDTGDVAGARSLHERALEIRESSLGREHPDLAHNLQQLAALAPRAGDRELGRRLNERALALRERTLGPDHPFVASSLTSIANQLMVSGETAGAVPLFERALRIWEAALPPEHPDLGVGLHNLALARADMGEYQSAEPLYERALAIWEKSLGSDHPRVAACLNNLGLVYSETGDLLRARKTHERALAIRRKALGPDHAAVGASLTNLADVALALGDTAQALALLEEAQEVWNKAFGPEHPRVAFGLLDLGIVHLRRGDGETARKQSVRALELLERAFGPGARPVATALANLGIVLHESGDLPEARRAYERALGIVEEKVGPDHPRVAEVQYNLATLLSEAGDLAGATRMHTRSLALREKVLGSEHPLVARSLVALADLMLESGEYGDALEAALRAERIGREHLRLTAHALPERKALLYASGRASGIDIAVSLAALEPDAAETRRIWDAVILSRACVLDEMALRRRAAVETADPVLEKLADAVAEARRGLANLVVKGPGEESIDRYRDRLGSARRKEDRAERALAERSLAFRRESARRKVGLEEVRSALPPGAALIAYKRYDRRTAPAAGARKDVAGGRAGAGSQVRAPAGPLSSYMAFVLGAGAEEAVAVPLGSAAEIEPLVLRWRSEAEHGSLPREGEGALTEAAYRRAGEALRRRIWDPLIPHLGGATRAFVVPDGALHLVSLAALPAGDSGYLVESGPPLHYLSAERDLVPSAERDRIGRGLLAMGGPAYDQRPAAPAPERSVPAGSSASRSSAPGGAAAFRGSTAACDDFRSMRFEPLPASASEAEQVSAIWRGAGRAKSSALSLVGPEASEAAFKESAPGRRVLHLATHGFFIGGGCRSALEGTRGIGGLILEGIDGEGPVAGENPLLLSGLALAGANRRAAAGPGEEDGILTAEEIAAVDLSAVEWAVLSACDTGTGEMRAGEGVLGLRRAFQIAGARTIIMSLWSVDDETTRSWMAALYEARLGGHMDTASAVREASLALLRARRSEGRSAHPFYWGAFVASGDWR